MRNGLSVALIVAVIFLVTGATYRMMKKRPPRDRGNISDGYHTFNELYDHRIALWIALCRTGDSRCLPWRSELHSDGSRIEGWFILGMCRSPGDQITYHLPMSKWEDCNFAVSISKAPEFDGHTPADVIERLNRL